MKKILLVSYSFIPFEDPQSLRWYYLSRYLARNGYEVDVLTVNIPYVQKALRLENNSIRTIRVFPGFYSFFTNFFKRSFFSDGYYKSSVRISSNFLTLKKMHKFFKKILDIAFPGDFRSEWFIFAISRLISLGLNRYSVLITSQEPFVDTLIGMFLKILKPDLFWIADFGDTMFAPYYLKLKRIVDGFIEKGAMKMADKIIVTNHSVVKQIESIYGINRKKISVITQGYPSLLDIDKSESRENKLTMLFCGTFYSGFREPDALLYALERMQYPIEFLIAGRNEEFYEKFSRIRKVKYLGYISHSEILSLQRKVDVLVNISNKQTHQLAGKLFEYLGTTKPILNIVYSPYDESIEIISSTGCGITCMNEPEMIYNALNFFAALHLKGKLKRFFKCNKEKIEFFNWDNLGSILKEVIENIGSTGYY